MSPFRLEQCLKITESQCNCTLSDHSYRNETQTCFAAFLDDITNLRDPQLFLHIIQEELNSRTERGSKKGDTLKNSSFVASVVATRWAKNFERSKILNQCFLFCVGFIIPTCLRLPGNWYPNRYSGLQKKA